MEASDVRFYLSPTHEKSSPLLGGNVARTAFGSHSSSHAELSPIPRAARRSRHSKASRAASWRRSRMSPRSPSFYHDSTPSVYFYPEYAGLSDSPTTSEIPAWLTQLSSSLPSTVTTPSSFQEPQSSKATSKVPSRKVTICDPKDNEQSNVETTYNSVPHVRWTVVESEEEGIWKKDEFEGISTLMLRGVPNRLTKEMLWAEIESRGFKDDIDFFNLPGDIVHQRNVGYCFVNLTSTEAVQRFRDTFEGSSLGFGKICHVGVGKVQGLQKNLEASSENAAGKREFLGPGASSKTVSSTSDSVGKKKTRSAKKQSVHIDSSQNTTLMVRNIPNSYSRDSLMQLLEEKGLGKDINFFYVPIDFRYRRNVGYCFVNAINEEAAQRIRHTLDGIKLEGCPGSKSCEVVLAQVQGLQANIDAYRNSALMNMPEKFHPMVFNDGVHQPFPTPNLNRQDHHGLQTKKGVSKRHPGRSDEYEPQQQSQQHQNTDNNNVISLHAGLNSLF